VVSCEASITTRSTLGTGKSSARLGSGASAKNGKKTKLNSCVRVSYHIASLVSAVAVWTALRRRQQHAHPRAAELAVQCGEP